MSKTAGYAARLREARSDAGMSLRRLQQQVSRRAGHLRGSSYAGLRSYEAGRVEHPRREILEAIADALNVNRRWLIEGEGTKDQTAAEALAALEVAERDRERRAQKQDDDDLATSVERALTEHADVTDSKLLQSPVVQGAFHSAWSRLIDGCQTRNLTPEQTNTIGRHLLAQLKAPLEAWGFEHELDPRGRAFEDYAVALLHALMTAMPRSGRGDPAEMLSAGE